MDALRVGQPVLALGHAGERLPDPDRELLAASSSWLSHTTWCHLHERTARKLDMSLEDAIDVLCPSARIVGDRNLLAARMDFATATDGLVLGTCLCLAVPLLALLSSSSLEKLARVSEAHPPLHDSSTHRLQELACGDHPPSE